MANNLHSKICTSIISGGECKRPGCWFSHNKEFISEKITNYAHHVYGHYVITCTDDSTSWNDQQFYIPWYMICEYLSSKKIDIDTFDFNQMKYEGYYDNRNNPQQKRYTFLKIKGIFQKNQLGNNLMVTREVNGSATSISTLSPVSSSPKRPLPRTVAVPLNSVTEKFESLTKFVNEISADVSIQKMIQKKKDEEVSNTITNLTKTIEEQQIQIDQMKSELNKKRNIEEPVIEPRYKLRKLKNRK